MKKNHTIKKAFFLAIAAAMTLTMTLGVNVIMATVPEEEPPGTGITPTFTGLTVNGGIEANGGLNADDGTIEVNSNMDATGNILVEGNIDIQGVIEDTLDNEVNINNEIHQVFPLETDANVMGTTLIQGDLAIQNNGDISDPAAPNNGDLSVERVLWPNGGIGAEDGSIEVLNELMIDGSIGATDGTIEVDSRLVFGTDAFSINSGNNDIPFTAKVKEIGGEEFDRIEIGGGSSNPSFVVLGRLWGNSISTRQLSSTRLGQGIPIEGTNDLGKTSIWGDLAARYINGTDNTDGGGTLYVDGTSTLWDDVTCKDKLNVDGALEANGGIKVTGDVGISGNLSVNGKVGNFKRYTSRKSYAPNSYGYFTYTCPSDEYFVSCTSVTSNYNYLTTKNIFYEYGNMCKSWSKNTSSSNTHDITLHTICFDPNG
ncbi:hypothetical protein ACFL21_04445 [Patescibacteria group bacterium]